MLFIQSNLPMESSFAAPVKTYLSKFGYVIKKQYISEDDVRTIKSELVARPLIDSKYGDNKQCYNVFVETKNKLYIPRRYGIEKFGIPDREISSYHGKKLVSQLQFIGDLRANQQDAFAALKQSCSDTGGGILQLGTGLGKTVIATKLFADLSVKTLVIVNKIPLMTQWENEIQQFVPRASIGKIQGQRSVDVFNKDIVIGMLQSLSMIDYPDKLFEDFGLVIVDEVHNISSRIFSKILFKINCPYMIGLSATPERADGLSYVFKWHLGDVLYKSTSERKGLTPIVQVLRLKSKSYKQITSINKFTGQEQIQYTSMLTDLVNMTSRNDLIITLIIKCAQDNRKVLVLSDRRQHILCLRDLLNSNSQLNFSYGMFLGQMKSKELEKSKKSDVILATYKAFGEGVSEKDLDTLILITPKKYIGHLNKPSGKKEAGSLEQIVGRIFRKEHVDRHPLIIDLHDQFSVYKAQSYQRIAFYKRHLDHITQTFDVDLDNQHEFIDQLQKHRNVLHLTKSSSSSSVLNEIEQNNLPYTKCMIDDV